MKTLFFSSLMLVAFVLVGEDLITKSGKVYKNYSITGVTHRGVTVEFPDGIANVPLSELPEDLREKYASKVAKKKTSAKKKADARKRAAGLKRITFVLSGDVECIQVIPKKNAILANHGGYTTYFCITHIDTSKIVDGNILKGNRIATVLWRNSVLLEITKKKEKVHVLYCIGQFQYKTALGSSKTIPLFTIDKSQALEYLEKHPNADLVGISRDPAYCYILPEYSVGKFDMQQKPVISETGQDVLRRMQHGNQIRQDHIRFQQRFERRGR